MEDASLQDFKNIGASPYGLSEKRRAFLILRKILNEESSEHEWERAQRILYHIKRNVMPEHLDMYFKGFDKFLIVVDKNAPDILEDVLLPIGNIPPAVDDKKKTPLTEDEKLLEQYYQIFGRPKPNRKKKKKKKKPREY